MTGPLVTVKSRKRLVVSITFNRCMLSLVFVENRGISVTTDPHEKYDKYGSVDIRLFLIQKEHGEQLYRLDVLHYPRKGDTFCSLGVVQTVCAQWCQSLMIIIRL